MSLEGIFPIDMWDFHSSGILEELHEEERQTLMRYSKTQLYKKGMMIFREGATPLGIYYVQSGTIKKYKIDNMGHEHIFYVAGAGELFGYHALLAEEGYPDSSAALQDSLVCFIPAQDFLEVLSRSPKFSKCLFKILSHECSVLINNLSVFAQRPVKERVAITLIVLREKFKKHNDPSQLVEVAISRSDIAHMAGTTRENVARALSEFRQSGIIDSVGRKILIIDVRRLVEESNYL